MLPHLHFRTPSAISNGFSRKWFCSSIARDTSENEGWAYPAKCSDCKAERYAASYWRILLICFKRKSTPNKSILMRRETCIAIGAACVIVAVGVGVGFAVSRPSPPSDDDKIAYLKSIVSGVAGDGVAQSIDLQAAKESYTLDKKYVKLCLRDEHSALYEDNMLVFVLLHEIAHVMNDTVGHDESFMRIFKKLLATAEILGYYDSSIPLVQNYCGYK